MVGLGVWDRKVVAGVPRFLVSFVGDDNTYFKHLFQNVRFFLKIFLRGVEGGGVRGWLVVW